MFFFLAFVPLGCRVLFFEMCLPNSYGDATNAWCDKRLVLQPACYKLDVVWGQQRVNGPRSPRGLLGWPEGAHGFLVPRLVLSTTIHWLSCHTNVPGKCSFSLNTSLLCSVQLGTSNEYWKKQWGSFQKHAAQEKEYFQLQKPKTCSMGFNAVTCP